ncbi:MAG: hypothetical protein ACR2I0_14195 [Rhodoferax sp.]
MDIPAYDRSQNIRPLSAQWVAPLAPKEPAPTPAPTPEARANSSGQATPGVVNLVNLAAKPSTGEAVFASVSDPGQRGSEAATAPKDWTVHRPVAEKEQEPPLKPVSQMLIEQLKALWNASANAIQSEQVKNQVAPAQIVNPSEVPGALAKEVLTYSPNRIKRPGNV